METGYNEATPDVDELLQEVNADPAIPVRQQGPVLTQELPSKRAQGAMDVVPISRWTSLLPATPKRKCSVLISTDNPFYFSFTGTGTTGILWPANVPLVMGHTEQVQVMSAHATDTATISHFTELWAD
jgi:hypothetical protein